MDDNQKAIAGVIEEAVFRRVDKTISAYVKKNQRAFKANRILGVEWSLQIGVMTDDGVNIPETPKPKISIFKRFINGSKSFFGKANKAPEN